MNQNGDRNAAEPKKAPIHAGSAAGVLDQDVNCPGCGYNLRGLAQDIATCPECGLTSDIARLLTRRWDKPWYRAPKFNLLCLPAAVPLLTGLALLITVGVLDLSPNNASKRAVVLTFCVGGMAFWGCLMAWIFRKMDGLVSAGFALLAHAAIVGYFASIPMFIGGLVMTFVWLADRSGYPRPSVGDLLISLAFLVGGVVAYTLARWFERMIAAHCIRLYLRQPTKIDRRR